MMIPVFATREAEANWFEQHRKQIEADIGRRLRSGDGKTLAQALAQSAAKERAKLQPITIRMRPDDLSTARRLAEGKGMPYQTYIKVLLREALRREVRRVT